MTLSDTARRAIEAYGGAERWQKAGAISATISASGLAFAMKWRPRFRRIEFRCDVHRPRARVTPIGRRPGLSGVLDGAEVRLEAAEGRVLSRRAEARSAFPYGRRLLWWDDLDMAYFAGYATWNYVTMPALLMNPDITWRETAPGELAAEFPGQIPTHSRHQRFRFDAETGLLLQHDYVAEVIGGFARVANRVLAHDRNSGGLVYPSRRRVTPRGADGAARRFPVLIDLTFHDFALT